MTPYPFDPLRHRRPPILGNRSQFACDYIKQKRAKEQERKYLVIRWSLLVLGLTLLLIAFG